MIGRNFPVAPSSPGSSVKSVAGKKTAGRGEAGTELRRAVAALALIAAVFVYVYVLGG